MGKFLLGVLVGVIVAVLGSLIIVLAVGRLFASKQPTVAANSVLVLTLDGELPEAPPVDLPLPFFESQSPPTIRDFWTSLRAAAKDNRIKAVLLQPRDIAAGWGKLQEIRQELVDFKKSGKPVYAYLQRPGTRAYYLATVADKVFISPDDMLEVKGFGLEEMYFKSTLDKLGVSVQVDHIGRYKDAGDIFTRGNMTPETREVLGQVLDQIYGDFCASVAQGRHKSPDDIRSLIDMGPFEATQAKASGLVDELAYEDQVYADLKKRTGVSDLNKLSIRTYFKAAPGRGDRIALLVGEGDIVTGDPEGTVRSGDNISSVSFEKTIRQVREDGNIKGVILRVNSPGGDAVASDEILHELKLLSAAKPLVISMSDVAASGGYFISLTGDSIISYPNTITGSIGVLYVRPNLHGLYDKLGIQTDALKRGRLADMDFPDVPLSDAAQQKLHESIQATYQSFVGKVASARKKTYEQIDTIAQGRVWMGTQARENGLVDQLGGLDQAIATVRQRAHLPLSGDTNLVTFPPRRSLLDVLATSASDMSAEAAVETRLRKTVPGLPGPALLHGGVLRVLPYKLIIQ